jgi:1,4-dihydroxy-2-naphthoate octaprenyltransferase
MKKNPFFLFVNLSRPILLLGGIGQMLLGTGIARYLGRTIRWDVFFFSALWLLLVQLAANYLNEYFDDPVDRENENRTLFSGGSGVLGQGEDKLRRRVALSAFVAATTLAVAVIISMIWLDVINSGAVILMAIIFLAGLAYSLPPVQLARSGYGEFVAAVIGGYLIPMFAFVVQTGEAHRLAALTSLPVTLLFVVYFLAVSFPDYATDLKYGKRTFLIRTGWESTMAVHNSLILLAMLALVSLWFFDVSSDILWPTFLVMPLGFLQFWQMRQIASGAKPNWRLLTLNAASLVGMLIYLFAYTFWTR